MAIRPLDVTRPLLVAEISGNHRGSRSLFLELIEASAESGADMVKFQTYTADTITLNVNTENFRVSAGHELWGDRNLYSLYEQAHTPWEWQAEGFALARSLGIDAFSSPFDRSAVDFLEQFDPPAYKIASIEVTDPDLIAYAAGTGRPMVISGGAATTAELATAIELANTSGAAQVIPLLCTSSYPARPDDARLATLPVWSAAFGFPVGLSDHTLGIGVSVAAVALGARLIEKHITLDRSAGGVDSQFSMEPAEMAQLAEEMDNAWVAVQGIRTGPVPGEQESLRFRRSLYVAEDVKAGDVITGKNVRSVRPAGGMAPRDLPTVLGLRFVVDAAAGTPLSRDLYVGSR